MTKEAVFVKILIMLEPIVLGIIQGIAEWLPVSSEGLLVLTKINIFGSQDGIESIIKEALFLHLGTFSAALIYLRKDVVSLLRSFVNYRSTDEITKKTLNFLIIATLVSGLLGFLIINIFINLESGTSSAGKIITLIVGILLIITGILQIKTPRDGYKRYKDLNIKDGLLLGVAQGFSALPGLSRSGFTVSALLLRKYGNYYALKLSFLMSLPIVLGGNIILNLNNIAFSVRGLIGLLFSFLAGLLTIDLLLKVARKINFGYFVLIFGLLTIIAVFI